MAYTNQAQSTPYCEGTTARNDNKLRSTNPYCRTAMPLSHVGWEDGWLSTNQQLMTVKQQQELEGIADGLR